LLPLKKILCPTDFSPASEHALDEAAELALHFGAEMSVVHIVPVMPALPHDPNFTFQVPEYERALHADAEQKLGELVERLTARGVKAHSAVGHGDAGSDVVRFAESEGVDIIVIATEGMTGWRHVMFGSVAEKVVRLAKCSVLTVRAPRQ
jgi:nucleotide-binding universal stress UspA family protein